MSDILETSAAAEPAAPSSSGEAGASNGNSFAQTGEAKVADAPSERAGPNWREGLNEALNEARHRIDSLSHDDEVPIDLDQPAEWQGPEARQRADEIIKELQKQQQEPPQPKPERPSDYPRSWANDAVAFDVWNQLQPQLREQITSREQERDTATSRAQSESSERARQAEAAVAQAEQFNLASLEALLPELAPHAHLTQQQLEELGRTNPQEAARVRDLYARAETLSKRVEAFAQQRAERQRQQVEANQKEIQQAQEQFFERCRQSWEQQKASEDAEAARLVPDLADPAKVGAAQQRAMRYLKEDLGLTEQEITRLWHTDATFRSAKAQKLIHDASMWREAQEKARNAAPKVPPRPQLGGMNGGSGTLTGDAAAAAAAKSGDMAAYFRLRGNSGARR